MNRRDFLHRTSAGLAATALAPGVWSCATAAPLKKSFDFTPYRSGQSSAQVTCVTPDDGYYLHTYYDVCPWSPTGRYLAVTRFPYQKRKPRWGDVAQVCVIDLVEHTLETLYATKAWSFQLGANVQWGFQHDRYLYTNDIIDGIPACVQIDLNGGPPRAYSGAKYDLAPNESFMVSPNLLTMNTHQYGYAVPDPPSNRPQQFTPDDMPREGLWKTDLATDETQLLVNFDQFAAAVDDPEFYRGGLFYCSQSKVNPQSSRIMQVLRFQRDGKGRHNSLFAMDADGSNLVQCMSRRQWLQPDRNGRVGHHPNWHPDGQHIIMNCVPTQLGYRDTLFCAFKFDGSDFRVLSEKHLGTGHPSVDPNWRYLVTDAYVYENLGTDNGEIPIRLIDLKEDTERILCTIANDVGGGGRPYLPEDKKYGGSHHKLDPHPAWNRDYRQVCINGAPQGRRQVYVIDVLGR